MKIWVNTIVKNEDRYLWFAVKSVINYVDKLIIYDTGSRDKTVEIINLLKKEYPSKIIFEEYGEVDAVGFTKARQEMLDLTKGDWLFILDGDEVWWGESIKQLKDTIDDKGSRLDLIVSHYYHLVGDIYHYQEEKAGKYNILGKNGHLTIRAINLSIQGLHVDEPYPLEGYFDGNNKPIQQRDNKRIIFLDKPYLHLSYLQRSTLFDKEVMQRPGKKKVELGIPFPKDFKYPEVFYLNRPTIVPSPWEKMSISYRLNAFVQTPLKKLKRRVL